jgi:hypothetical protein
MVTTNKDNSIGGAAAFKKPAWTTVVVLALSLATWLFFYLKSMPLTGPDTAVVVGFWLAVALFGNWIWKRLHKKKQTE